MKIMMKIVGLTALLLSAPIANAKTYQLYINQYGGTTTTIIDYNSYQTPEGCGRTVGSITYGCFDRWIFNGEAYADRNVADAVATAWLEEENNAKEDARKQTPLQDKIESFVDAHQEITSASIEHIGTYADILKDKRFEELKLNTEWLIWDEDHGYYRIFNGTYDSFLSEVATEQVDQVDRIHYQVNNGTGQARIKLVNKDNTYFTEDWIYVSFFDSPETYVSDLIVGLSEESFQQGYKSGWYDGFDTGYEQGYADGYIDGYEDGKASLQ